MLFKMLACGCEPIAVAIIDAPDLAAAVALAASKFAATPSESGVRRLPARPASQFRPEMPAREFGVIRFDGFIYGDDVGEAMDLGDVRGDIPTDYNITPLGEGNYIKTGVYAD
jgi:hypothetical protein